MKTIRGKLTILVDNVVPGKSRFLGEHGFSLLLETDDGNWLFDTGRGGAIAHNAVAAQKDLRRLTGVVLSHSHADHTGGLPAVLAYHHRIPVYAHEELFAERYRLKPDGQQQFSGIPFKRSYIEKMGAELIFNTAPHEVAPGIHLTGVVPRTSGFEAGDQGGRYLERDGQAVPDIIADDQSLVLNTPGGYVVVLGCAHAGLINILSHIFQTFGEQPIQAVIGGTHLEYVEDAQLDKTIEALAAFAVSRLVPAHCTGISAAVRLAQKLPGCVRFSHVGFSLEF